MEILDQSYVRLMPGKIVSSLQLADDVVADFDAAGKVIGIEFLSAQAALRRDDYVAMARDRSLNTKAALGA